MKIIEDEKRKDKEIEGIYNQERIVYRKQLYDQKVELSEREKERAKELEIEREREIQKVNLNLLNKDNRI